MKIEFVPNQEMLDIIAQSPKPAKNYIPEWYKSQPTFNPKKPEFNDQGVVTSKGIKMCMPFLDSLVSGYIQSTWTDIWIDNDEKGVRFTYASAPQIIDARKESFVPSDKSYHDLEFVWKMHWSFKLPIGYSILLTHPLNRIDLPFTTLSGVIDNQGTTYAATDGGNLPFYLKKDFKGLIPAGTPMYQIIPFKRENWTSSAMKYNKEDYVKNAAKTAKKFWGVYKENYWNRKSYE